MRSNDARLGLLLLAAMAAGACNGGADQALPGRDADAVTADAAGDRARGDRAGGEAAADARAADARLAVDASADAPLAVDAPADAGADPRDAAVVDAATTDAAADAAGADGAGSWTPLAIAGLAVWLDGGKGVVTGAGGRVVRWEDQSRKGHDFSEPMTVAQPVLVGAAAHGRPALRFNGMTSRLSIFPAPVETASLQRGTGDFVVAIVAAVNNSYPQDSFATLYWEDGVRVTVQQEEVDTALLGGGTVYITGGKEPGQTYYDGAWRLHALYRFGGNQIEPRINGYPAGVSGPTDVPFPEVEVGPSPMTLGQLNPRFERAEGAAPLRGDIAEVVVARANRQELAALERYLIAKYAVNAPVKRDFGASCATDTQCVLGMCVQGVCCQTACGLTCFSCAVPGHRGGCWEIPGCDPTQPAPAR